VNQPSETRQVFVADPETAPERPMTRKGGRSVRLIDDACGARTVDLHLNILEGGGNRADAPYHLHTNAENVYFVLQGRLGLRLEDEDVVVEAGQAVFIPPHVPHAVWNAGDGEARLIEIYAPPGADFVRLEEHQEPQDG
jgi:mannose-6-phosphate isomerase-like protein (cupin superfamily)